MSTNPLDKFKKNIYSITEAVDFAKKLGFSKIKIKIVDEKNHFHLYSDKTIEFRHGEEATRIINTLKEKYKVPSLTSMTKRKLLEKKEENNDVFLNLLYTKERKKKEEFTTQISNKHYSVFKLQLLKDSDLKENEHRYKVKNILLLKRDFTKDELRFILQKSDIDTIINREKSISEQKIKFDSDNNIIESNNFNKLGKIKSKITYNKDGKKTSEVTYDKDGNKIFEVTYDENGKALLELLYNRVELKF